MVAVAESPSSTPTSAGRLHPTYKEMIAQALTELRDPSGSSRHAIADYIADHFSGLHTSHDALLSAHLRRLRSQGQVCVVSGNYLLSTAAPPPQQQRRGRGRPPKPRAAPGPKRGRGRPRKNPDLAPSAPIPVFLGPKRGPGRPRKNADAHVRVASSASPLQGAIAPTPPSGVKRGRGRPRKNALPFVSSFSPLPLAVAPPPPSGVKLGHGRPLKNFYPVASPLLGVEQGPGGWQQRNTIPVSLTSAAMPHSDKRKPGRPPKGAVAMGVGWGSSVNIYAGSNSVLCAKRGRGRPPKVVVAGKRKRGRPPKEKMQPESVQSVDAPLTKRGPGRPRKEKTVESGHLIAGQMTEGGHEALPTQAADHAGAVQDEGEAGRQTFDSSKDISLSSNNVFGVKRGQGHPPKEKMQPEYVQSVDAPLAVQNEVEAGNLQSSGTSLTEKRGRGRPRKRQLETEPSESGVAVLVEKRGRGRPRKENPSAGTSASTGIKRGRGRPRKENPSAGTSASTGIKRGRGRPRKAKPFETEFAETAVEVCMDFTEGGSEKDGDLASGKKAETQDVLLVEGMGDGPADAGCVLASGKEAAIAPRDAGGAMAGVDPV